MIWCESPFIVVAISTSGLPSKKYHPATLDIGAVLVSAAPENGGVRTVAGLDRGGVYSSLIRCSDELLFMPEARKARDLHGITPEMSRRAPTMDAVAISLNAWRESVQSQVGLIGGWGSYTNKFMIQMLESTVLWESLGGVLPLYDVGATTKTHLGLGSKDSGRMIDLYRRLLVSEHWMQWGNEHDGRALHQAWRTAQIAAALEVVQAVETPETSGQTQEKNLVQYLETWGMDLVDLEAWQVGNNAD